ncbi:MAG: 3-phosphoshikimate 1-carboxyvinyltransferase [Candidatus Eisenbacteria bacterium]|uniref:3-phosphoshikimate 1-carboxyvinyltransferase n=1 Tax=Eiseniibacteriota bacterium TaxID=2212470 RepID=A0A9D6QJG6_UNCEI|nr:3-phosphoshikimate 1-carboxyvinyltransferase [Candidatus Eisenbacteria bacterium]
MQPREPDAVIDCGNSGTTLRLLAGILAAQPFLSVLTGDASLNRRPVARVVEPLRRMGASLWARSADRFPPLAIRGARLRPLRYELPIPSAQVASCVLLAGLFAEGETSVAIPGPARDHTERLLRALGVSVEESALAVGGRQVTVTGPVRFSGATLRVPGDFSAAAFFLAAAAGTPGARVTASNVNLNPLRTGLLDVLEAMGARVEREGVRLECGEEVGTVTVTGPGRLNAFDVPPEWIPRLVDEVPAWVIAATSASGVSRIRGAQELRVKESDRLSALTRHLAALGVEVREHPDGLDVTGGPLEGGRVDAECDHRVAMTFATLAVRARGPIRIDGAATIATSYPDFAETLERLGGRVSAMDPGAHRT